MRYIYWHNSLPPICQEFRLIQNILINALWRSACWSIRQVFSICDFITVSQLVLVDRFNTNDYIVQFSMQRKEEKDDWVRHVTSQTDTST
jgi:hypothetical protein